MKGGVIIGFFKKLANSVININLYPQMLRQGFGKAVLYLFLFSLIFGTLNSVILGFQLNRDIGNLVTQIKDDIPEFTFKNGELDVNEPMPITYTEPDNTIIIIDTTGGTEPDILDEYESATLVLRDKIINKKNPVETRVFSFQDFKGMSFNKNDVVNLLPYLKWFSVIAGILMWLAFFIGKFFSALLLSIISLIISKIRKTKLSFGQLYSLGIYSLTLPVLIDILLNLFYLDLPNLIYYMIAIIYSWLVINRVKRQAKEISE